MISNFRGLESASDDIRYPEQIRQQVSCKNIRVLLFGDFASVSDDVGYSTGVDETLWANVAQLHSFSCTRNADRRYRILPNRVRRKIPAAQAYGWKQPRPDRHTLLESNTQTSPYHVKRETTSCSRFLLRIRPVNASSEFLQRIPAAHSCGAFLRIATAVHSGCKFMQWSHAVNSCSEFLQRIPET